MTTETTTKNPHLIVPSNLLAWSLALVWACIMTLFFHSDLLSSLGGYAFGSALLLWIVHRAQLRSWFVFSTTEVGLGVAAGLCMVGLTYVSFSISTVWLPFLIPEVKNLYALLLPQPISTSMIFWMFWIICMEEVLFRGFFTSSVRAKHPDLTSLWELLQMPSGWKSVGYGTAVYTLVHVGAGAWLLCLLSLVCGCIWGWMRVWRDSLTMPLVAHIVWNLFVFILYPLAS